MSLLSKALHLHQDNNMDKDLFGILEIKKLNKVDGIIISFAGQTRLTAAETLIEKISNYTLIIILVYILVIHLN